MTSPSDILIQLRSFAITAGLSGLAAAAPLPPPADALKATGPGGHIATPAVPRADPFLQARPAALRRWDDLTYGLFLHWDMSSVLGVEISWAKANRVDVAGHGEIPDEIYDTLYRSFNPQQFDAKAFVTLAQEAGMRYLVITAKHHGGFCMFDSQLNGYKIAATAFGRDVVKELAAACHEAGVAFGFYYSPPDWHHPAFLAKDFNAYQPYLFGQLRELCTNYGQIDILFFDGLFYGEKEYHSRDLFRMIRELQPDIVINNRGGLPGDYDTPEQAVGAFQNTRAWESCVTLGTSWSWKTGDQLKSAAECIRILVATVGGDGNLLLNVGPMPTGMIEPRQAAVLRDVGAWLRRNGESIYALRGGPYKPAAWGACTSTGHTLYLHVISWFDLPDWLPELGATIERATFLDGRPVPFTQNARGVQFAVPPADRDPLDTIMKVTLSSDATALAPLLVPTRSLARGCRITASHQAATARALVDDDPQTEWRADSPHCWVEVDLGRERRFNRIDLREEGPEWEMRTKGFELSYRSGTEPWTRLDRGEKIGHTYSKTFPAVTGRFLRLQVDDAGKPPRFSEFQVYERP